VTEISQVIGAVNTILNEDGRLIGTTTDPEGFLEGYREKGHSFIGQSVAILGNGGSARTIAYALLMQDRPKSVVIVARDVKKSQALASEITERLGLGAGGALSSPEVIALSDYHTVREGVDVVVNTTPVGMHPNVEVSPLGPDDLVKGQVVYDIVYAPERTRLIAMRKPRASRPWAAWACWCIRDAPPSRSGPVSSRSRGVLRSGPDQAGARIGEPRAPGRP